MARRTAATALAVGITLVLAACGPTPEEQRTMDVQRCGGYGFGPGTDAFARCMMDTSQRREAQQAADQRAAADRAARDRRVRDALQAQKDRADLDAWDRRTGQGAYSSLASPFGPSAPDRIRDQIERDQRRIEGLE
jgi:hypothetical protein